MEELIKQDQYIQGLLAKKIIKFCPNVTCKVLTEKIDGCNYVQCSWCKSEWCWECNLLKYSQCNDKSHNSH